MNLKFLLRMKEMESSTRAFAPCLNAWRNIKVFWYFLLANTIWIDRLGFLFCIAHLSRSYLNAKANGFLPKGLNENKAKRYAPRAPLGTFYQRKYYVVLFSLLPLWGHMGVERENPKLIPIFVAQHSEGSSKESLSHTLRYAGGDSN